MPFKKGQKAWNKGMEGYSNEGTFKPGNKAWNKGKKPHMPHCKLCGTFMSPNKKHYCKNVDLRGDRFCLECNKKLKNKGWERYSKVCGRCGKIIQRQKQRELRDKLIKQFGGKCQICNYSKCKACLEFHHKDRKMKKGKNFLKDVLKYPEKFNLWCNRCHREIEFKDD